MQRQVFQQQSGLHRCGHAGGEGTELAAHVCAAGEAAADGRATRPGWNEHARAHMERRTARGVERETARFHGEIGDVERDGHVERLIDVDELAFVEHELAERELPGRLGMR